MPDAEALTELSKRLDGLTQALGELRADLRQGIDQFRQEIIQLRQEVQAGDAALRQEMQAGLAAVRQEIAQLRVQELGQIRLEMQAYFRWTITTMIALFAVAVPIWIAVISFVLQRLLR
jgi:DNA anti-recombination protein RmuC